MMSAAPVILWFRNDLRLADHGALKAALASGAPVVPLYILDCVTAARWSLGGAARWWLGNSLAALSRDLAARGGALILRRGSAETVLQRFVAETGARAVYMTRGYEPWAVAQEDSLKKRFDADGIDFKRYGGRLMREPEEVRSGSGDAFKVYTAFWRAFAAGYVPPAPIQAPKRVPTPPDLPPSDDLADWGLLPEHPDWAGGLRSAWQPGEAGARNRLARFVAHALDGYAERRNRLDLDATSRLSPHLAFGEITPAACWRAAQDAAACRGGMDQGLEAFLKELCWREFAYTLLHRWPDLPQAPLRKSFTDFPWAFDSAHLSAWQRGETGYPIVDAGMRELYATGYMHNRARMIVASFLVKHLLIPWQAGEAWFWETLVDADLANNAASWQWVAGSGADAAPYFRIFNPVLQGEKFDPDGAYVRRWVPELSALPSEVIHAPWQCDAATLAAAGIVLGETYPLPIVEHSAARDRALSAYKAMKAADATSP